MHTDLRMPTAVGGSTGDTSMVRTKPCVVHRDLNTRNILVKADLSCCIADFGFALKMYGSRYEWKGEMALAETKSVAEVSASCGVRKFTLNCETQRVHRSALSAIWRPKCSKVPSTFANAKPPSSRSTSTRSASSCGSCAHDAPTGIQRHPMPASNNQLRPQTNQLPATIRSSSSSFRRTCHRTRPKSASSRRSR